MGEAFLHRRVCSQRSRWECLVSVGRRGWETAPPAVGRGCKQTPAPHCRTQHCLSQAPIELRTLWAGGCTCQAPRTGRVHGLRIPEWSAGGCFLLSSPSFFRPHPPSPSSAAEGLKHSGPLLLCPKDSLRLRALLQ